MAIPFSGTCLDSVDGDISDQLLWSSSLTGYLFQGKEGTGPKINPDPPYNLDPNGVGSFELIAGEQVIRATCTDSDGNEEYAEVTITVSPIVTPTVTIQQPQDGATYQEQ